MSEALKRCHAQETAACCCVDVGTIIDNSDCGVIYHQHFSLREQAEQRLHDLTEKARQIESEPCCIKSHFSLDEEGVALRVDFVFSCQAEAMIFQLALR